MLAFGEYLPDVGPLENPGLLDCQNILPASAGYTYFPGPSNISTNTLDARPQGGGSFPAQDNTATIYTFVGTIDKLYSFASHTFTDVSQMGGYATAVEDSWEFAAWGNTVIATNFGNTPQVVTLGSPPFADLGGSPPKAKHIATVDSFVVLGFIDDGTIYPYRVQWSGINNSTTWATSAVTQADFNDLFNEGGNIQKIIGGEFGLIFQERTITRMSYIGAPLIFQFDLVETARGALAANSVVKVGANVAFLAQDGFFVFNGQQSLPIGDGKVDQTFFNDVDIGNLYLMTVALYPTENIICWSYKSINAQTPAPDTILLYNYSPDSKVRWAYAKIDNYLMFNPISTGYTLDGLDAVSTNLDSLPVPPPNDISLDSPYWQGSLNILGVITPDLYLAACNGAPLNGTIETGEAWLQEPNRTWISLIRPHIDMIQNGTVTAQIAARNLESEQVSYGAVSTLNSAGYIPVRANARFMRAKFNITGTYNQAQGFDIISTTPVGRQ